MQAPPAGTADVEAPAPVSQPAQVLEEQGEPETTAGEPPPAPASPPSPAAPGLGSVPSETTAAPDEKASTPREARPLEEAEQEAFPDDAGTDVLDKSYYRSSPELWISHIERLLSEGRFEDARREFEAFKARHPSHPYAANQ